MVHQDSFIAFVGRRWKFCRRIEVSEGGDTVLQEGVDHPGGGMGVAARVSQRDAAAPEITTASGYALSAAPTLQTNQGSSFLGSRGSNPGTSFPGWSARVLVESRG